MTILLSCFVLGGIAPCQDVTTVETTGADISDDLDLEQVALVFGEAKDLEDFELRLNDPQSCISNLDLNEDGYVDYLRVIERAKGDVHVITIQAMLGKDLYQDVATIDVKKDATGRTNVQFVGDVYIYGPHYHMEPIYMHAPLILLWFWGPLYSPWHSPFHWGYYPPGFYYWRPYPTYIYIEYNLVPSFPYHTYTYVRRRTCITCANLQKNTRRNDLEKKDPERTFAARNSGVTNKQELNELRAEGKLPMPAREDATKSTGKEVKKDGKPASEQKGEPSKVNDGKLVVPKKETEQRGEDRPARYDQGKEPSRVPEGKDVKPERPKTQPQNAPVPSKKKRTKNK